MKKTKIVQVGFELTRRCNMRCRFCSRGEAQDIDITKEIIDKALDELIIVYIKIHIAILYTVLDNSLKVQKDDIF